MVKVAAAPARGSAAMRNGTGDPWPAAKIDDALTDDAIIAALKGRLKYVHSTPAQALAQVVREPNVATKPNNFGEKAVDVPVLVAFAGSVLYSLSAERAATLLTNASGAAKTLSNTSRSPRQKTSQNAYSNVAVSMSTLCALRKSSS